MILVNEKTIEIGTLLRFLKEKQGLEDLDICYTTDDKNPVVSYIYVVRKGMEEINIRYNYGNPTIVNKRGGEISKKDIPVIIHIDALDIQQFPEGDEFTSKVTPEDAVRAFILEQVDAVFDEETGAELLRVTLDSIVNGGVRIFGQTITQAKDLLALMDYDQERLDAELVVV